MPLSAAIEALRSHPRFSAAMRQAAGSAVALYQGDRILNALMSDRARALFSHVALYLHYHRTDTDEPGLTVGAMKDLCTQLKLCSRGRCEAMLALMRAAGYLTAVPNLDRRRRPLAPTEKLFALHRDRWGAHFEALQQVLPEAASYRAAVQDPEFIRSFVTTLGERFIAGLRILGHSPALGMFAERNAGMIVLYSLALGGPEDGPFPAEVPVDLSINALAIRCSVSRKHVLTILRDAQAEGLLVRGGPSNNEVTLLPRGREALEMFFATLFLYLAQCAQEALRASATAGPAAALADAIDLEPFPF